jgi:xanthine dehydrogenase accessory factor
VEIIDRGDSGMMATAVDPGRWQEGQVPKLFFVSETERIGSLYGQQRVEDALAGEMCRIMQTRRPANVSIRDVDGNQIDFYMEPVMSEPMLYVFGGGHVSLQIVPMAARVGFRVVVIDDRPEFADPIKFPEAADVHEYPFEGVFDRLSIDRSSYIVIVTRGHIHDRTVLAQALKTGAGYIGMIGSRRKRAIIYKKLLEEGFTQDDLDRVYSPIGVGIHAETPEEIAVSIVAELIKVRAETLSEETKRIIS